MRRSLWQEMCSEALNGVCKDHHQLMKLHWNEVWKTEKDFFSEIVRDVDTKTSSELLTLQQDHEADWKKFHPQWQLIVQSDYFKNMKANSHLKWQPRDMGYVVEEVSKQLIQQLLLTINTHPSSSITSTDSPPQQPSQSLPQTAGEQANIWPSEYTSYPDTVQPLIIHKRYQQALWLLREENDTTAAENLEQKISNLMSEEPIKVEPLGGGFTRTQLVTFEHGIQAVFKADVNPFRHPIENIVGSSRKEIAAFRLDSLLSLNKVPITIPVQIDGQNGSAQLFVPGGKLARDHLSITSRTPHKWSRPSGRAEKSGDTELFDWLIENRDRNVENYIILPNGAVVLIDNGYSFFFSDWNSRSFKISRWKINRSLCTKIKTLAENPKQIREKMDNYPNPKMVETLVHRIQQAAKYYELEI